MAHRERRVTCRHHVEERIHTPPAGFPWLTEFDGLRFPSARESPNELFVVFGRQSWATNLHRGTCIVSKAPKTGSRVGQLTKSECTKKDIKIQPRASQEFNPVELTPNFGSRETWTVGSGAAESFVLNTVHFLSIMSNHYFVSATTVESCLRRSRLYSIAYFPESSHKKRIKTPLPK